MQPPESHRRRRPGTRVTASADTPPSRNTALFTWSERRLVPVHFHPSPLASAGGCHARQRPPFAQNTVDTYSTLPYSLTFGTYPSGDPSEAAPPPRSQTDHLGIQTDRPRRRAAGRGSPAQVPLPDAAPHARTHSRVLSGAGHAARPRRRPRAPDRGGGRQDETGERHEERRRALRAVREPGVRTTRRGAEGALPPRGEADADGSAPGAGVRAAEHPQALPSETQADSAGGAGRGEFGVVVRRLAGPFSAAGALRGSGPRTRGGGSGDVAAGHRLAADRADRSGGGAGGMAGPLRLSQDIETRVRRGRLRPDGQSAWRVVHASSTATVPK